jgi:methylenetetrahydrofolate reductase (NADPH)
MPIQSRAGLEKMSAMSGAQVPEWVRSRLDRAAAPGDVARIGVEIACELGAELLAGGVPGLHLYTMNRADPTRAIWSGLGLNG